ncbi:hypothetical protein [Streptomyces californicus]|uniref:hypothetical protein n=1 Tax=Streptomyces californicus TaxID=67351 RepID=UPI00382B8C14
MSDQPTAQTVGTHALAKAVEHADKAHAHTVSTYGERAFNEAKAAENIRFAQLYADIAKAAGLLANNT